MADNSYLHYETVTPLLKETLGILMSEESFALFRLVGGTNLSLRYGHRKSVDVDLFTDAECIAVSIFGYSNAFCSLIFRCSIPNNLNMKEL